MPILLRPDFDATHLRRLARESKNASQARRLLALATIYAGGTRTQAAELGVVSLQVVRNWVLCHEQRRSTRRSATVREMKEVFLGSAIRS